MYTDRETDGQIQLKRHSLLVQMTCKLWHPSGMQNNYVTLIQPFISVSQINAGIIQ